MIGGLLVDHEIERHDLRHQVGERVERAGVGIGQALRERYFELSIHRRGAQRDILNRLHQNSAPLGPLVHRVAEQVPRQAVHFAEVAVLVHRLRIHVVRREVIAPRQDQPLQLPLFARHAMQGLDVRGDGDEGNERRIGVHHQLAPGTLDRHRFDVAAVAREAPILDQAAARQQLHRVAVGAGVERHRQIELLRVDPQGGAGDRDAFGVARELELRRRRH